uniref:Membrane spanning 4-domains A8 n=1 Tax=Pelodiscus sinensis TaxID=13735 RepID=K7F2J8_PELSI
LQGEPLALGITQILVGAVLLAVGMVTSLADLYFWRLERSVHIPMWSGLLYVVSGALSVAAAKNPKIPLVKGTLGMNIISSLVAGCALILYLITLAIEFNYYFVQKLIRSCTLVLLLFTFLEFFISISTSAFWCKTVCRNSYTEVVMM